MSRWRTALAFLVAPAIVPLVGGTLHYFDLPPSFPDAELVAFGTVRMEATFTYVMALVLFAPAFFFLKSRKWLTLTSILLTATLIGALVKARYQLGDIPPSSTEEWLFGLRMVGEWAAAGTLSGLVFSLFARHASGSRQTKRRHLRGIDLFTDS